MDEPGAFDVLREFHLRMGRFRRESIHVKKAAAVLALGEFLTRLDLLHRGGDELHLAAAATPAFVHRGDGDAIFDFHQAISA